MKADTMTPRTQNITQARVTQTPWCVRDTACSNWLTVAQYQYLSTRVHAIVELKHRDVPVEYGNSI